MVSRLTQGVDRGSWRWSLRVAEVTAWGAALFFFLVLHVADLPTRRYRWGLVVFGFLTAWLVIQFRIVLPNRRKPTWIGWSGLLLNFGFASAGFALLRSEVLSAHLIFVPVIVATGLLTPVWQGLLASLLGVGCYWGITALQVEVPDGVEGVATTALFVLSGGIAGLLSREVRSHYRGEQEEHRLATAVRLRLMAVLDAVDEAILFRDRHGMVRVVNERAGELFRIDPDDYLGMPVVELLRTIARQTEDPEGFMETFQELRDEPELELRVWIEQIIPERRQLRMFSGPTFDEWGALVGRIEVFTDVSESVRRAAEVERLYEDARKTAESYQRSLLPASVPSLPRSNLVAHYIPAAGKRAVCGDFYDFAPWPDGRMGFVVGDVVGVGPAAANDSALARYTLRALMADHPDPSSLFEALNERILAQGGSERFVRLLLAIFDPERASLDYINAGHVPPIVYRSGAGEVEWLGEGGMALGIERDAQFKVGRIDLEPGDMLILYTDGVTEAPRNRRPFGQARLADLILRYGVGTPGELVQGIRRSVDAWVGVGELRDDLVLLVTQIVPDSLIGEPTRELVLPNEPARMGEIRSFVAGFLADVRAPVDPSHEILLAVGEAAANSCRHGRVPDKRSELRIRCAVEGETVTVTVADEGSGFDPEEIDARLPDLFASGGRGLFLMKELMDEVEITSTGEGTTVELKRRLF